MGLERTLGESTSSDVLIVHLCELLRRRNRRWSCVSCDQEEYNRRRITYEKIHPNKFRVSRTSNVTEISIFTPAPLWKLVQRYKIYRLCWIRDGQYFSIFEACLIIQEYLNK